MWIKHELTKEEKKLDNAIFLAKKLSKINNKPVLIYYDTKNLDYYISHSTMTSTNTNLVFFETIYNY